MKFLLSICILGLLVSASHAQVNAKQLNLGFEDATSDGRPVRWAAGGSELIVPDSYSAILDEAIYHSGKRSLHLHYVKRGGFGVATASLPLEGLRGNTVRISGWLKTQKVRGIAGIWLRVDGENGKTLAFNNMADSAFGGTNDWTQFSFDLPVADSAEYVYFGALLSGQGDEWYDDLNIEVIKGITEADKKSRSKY